MAAELSTRLQGGRTGKVVVPVSPGELIDKLTILEIKNERINDTEKVSHVRTELALLQKTLAESVIPEQVILPLRAELRAMNEKLWDVEDEIRRCDKALNFGDRFVELARSVYRYNDSRFGLKAKINELLNSPIAEQKEYSD